MISLIVVYNKKEKLDKCLLSSLKNQEADFETILIDNTKNDFPSAAEALNYGAKKAKGEYLMFVHQDIELNSKLWLKEAEKILREISDLGVAGVAGMSEKGKNNKERGKGCISDCGEIWQWSNSLSKPEEAQTLDDCLLIIPRPVFQKLQFDKKTFDGWHCYGLDYSLAVKSIGLKAYVLPLFVYHRSSRANTKDLLKYQKRIYQKHKNNFKTIYTTLGEISRLKLILKTYLEPLYDKLFPGWIEILKREISDCQTILDLGCGYNSPLNNCQTSFSLGVEFFEPYLEESQKKSLHNQYLKADVRTVDFKPKSFEAVLALELLEHLDKEEGYRLIKKMESWAEKKIIITTPNGYLKQDSYDQNSLQIHKSGWDVKELENLGFKVFGMNGWKKLRKEKGLIKYRPVLLWNLFSSLTQRITYYHPKLAFQLFAVKKLNYSTDETESFAN